MAAYSALTSLLLTLDNLHDQNLTISLNQDQLGVLREKVTFLQHCLQNCSTTTRENREAMEGLEIKIRDVAFQVEDLISATMYQANPLRTPRRFCFSITSFCTLINIVVLFVVIILHAPVAFIAFHFTLSCIFVYHFWIMELDSASPLLIKKRLVNLLAKIGTGNRQALNKIFEEIKLLAVEATSVIVRGKKDVQIPSVDHVSAEASSSSRYSRINEDIVVGMDSDLKSVKERLGYGTSKLQIVPIVGMGGICKTTLATLVYKDAEIRNIFDVCAWTTVSQDYCLRRVIQDLLHSANLPTLQGESNDGELGDHLYRSLHGRRYLIVLDDVWDIKIWDDMRRFLSDDNNRSRVLLTTRSSEVAHYANSGGPLHQMHFLKESESQRLLHGQVFGEEDCSDELKVIRDDIAQSCQGLPLALVVIGGLLSKISRTQDSWRSFAGNLLSAANTNDDNECMEILALSYYHLPLHLRPCILYMGMFPEDYTVPVTKLIQLWSAEGFLRLGSSKSPEELAKEFLKELVERNLILVDCWSSQGGIRKCKIHDVLRKLCLREARKEKFLSSINHQDDFDKAGIESYRRLIIHPNILEIHPDIICDEELSNSRVQTLMCIRDNLAFPRKDSFHYKPHRVLDLLALHFDSFPLELTKLVSLRYLAVSFGGPLHPYISRLQNLQTFIYCVGSSKNDFFLPVEIWIISNLRHIHGSACLLSTPPNGGNNLCIQTLAEVINLSFCRQILEKIKSLTKLHVLYDIAHRSFMGWEGHELQNLASLNHLEKLKLRVVNCRMPSQAVNPVNLAFPISLKKLTLSCCRIPWEHLKIVGALPNLEVLKLRRNACEGNEWKPIEGQFCRLISLELGQLDLVYWRADETHFPRLRHLTVWSCTPLVRIPLGIGNIPTLETIKLVDCHPGIWNSVHDIREEQEGSMGSSDLVVSVFSFNSVERR